VASADYLLVFRRSGQNPVPVVKPVGLLSYAGSRQIPADVLRFRAWNGKQTENRYSHWIWRQYASAFWDDVRIQRVLPFRDAKDPDDEKHVHPLQLDVIERIVTLWSNPGETVFTPFMAASGLKNCPASWPWIDFPAPTIICVARFSLSCVAWSALRMLCPGEFRMFVRPFSRASVSKVEFIFRYPRDWIVGGVRNTRATMFPLHP
jgi:hypothetical protein